MSENERQCEWCEGTFYRGEASRAYFATRRFCNFACYRAHRRAQPRPDLERRRMVQLWRQMVRRCTDDRAPSWRYYGGRGISVCAEWLSFENFATDMGERPKGTSLDRIDNDGPYSPENCRWATPAEQGVNRRNTNMVEVGGELVPLIQYCRAMGVASETIRYRLRVGWPIERALTAPVQRKNPTWREREL